MRLNEDFVLKNPKNSKFVPLILLLNTELELVSSDDPEACVSKGARAYTHSPLAFFNISI